MKKIRFFFEYFFLNGFGFVLRLLPRTAVLYLGARAGDLIYWCIPVRKTLTLEHLRGAYPDKNDKEIGTIARGAYRNLAMNSLEHICLQHMSKEQILEVVGFNNEELIKRAYARGKGVILVGGHFGNWEYMGCGISLKGYPITYVVAGIENPYIDTMVNDHRRKAGIKILPKGMSVRSMLKTLRGNGSMAMLMDQDAGRSGIFIDFMGKQCSTPRGPALFALKTGAAILFVSAVRQTDGSVMVVCDDIEVDYEKGATDENIRDIMTRCTKTLELYVNKYPDQWLWMHRRWKTQPHHLQ